jgi:hypothetical protein
MRLRPVNELVIAFMNFFAALPFVVHAARPGTNPGR